MASSDRDTGLLKDVYSSIVFLTRLPAPSWPDAAHRPLAPAMWAFPLAGALVGILAGVTYGIADLVGCPPAVSAFLCIAAAIVATGGLHEDGLSDLADGAWAGTSPAARLAVMSDSRIGALGALALIVSVGARVAAVATIAEPAFVLGAMIAAGAASRATMPVVVAFGTAAKHTGLGASAGKPDFTVWAGGIALAALIAIFAAPGGWFACLVAAAAGAVLVAWFEQRTIGGYTGDVLGAVQQIAEILALALIAAAVTEAG